MNFYEHMHCTFDSPKTQADLALLVAYAGGTKSEAGLSTCYQNSEVLAVPAVRRACQTDMVVSMSSPSCLETAHIQLISTEAAEVAKRMRLGLDWVVAVEELK